MKTAAPLAVAPRLAQQSLLRVEHLSKRYGGTKALQDITFTITEGSVVGIVGPNGAGKTTLFDVLTGLSSLDTGAVWLANRRLGTDSLEQLARIGIVRTFQEISLPSDLTVAEYLALGETPATTSGVIRNLLAGSGEWQSAKDRARELAARIGISDKVNQRCSLLSLGEQRLLSVVRAIWSSPRLLLLDEPTQNCSPASIRTLKAMLAELKSRGSSVIVISHDHAFAHEISDRMLYMESGQISEVERRSNLNQSTWLTPKVADLIPCVPILQVRELDVAINRFRAVSDASLDIYPHRVTGITGANGAGKSTLLKGIVGLATRQKGQILLDGKDVSQLPPFSFATHGVGLMLQGARLPARLSVEDALRLAWEERGTYRNAMWSDVGDIEKLFERFPPVSRRRTARCGVLSAGELQMLALMMCIASRPRVLLLDEPSVGLHPSILESLFAWLTEATTRGLALVIVEQQVEALRRVAHSIITLDRGRIVEEVAQ
jgi:ABC-type branched-subunit amino acid transport system ATPase component